ncbi:MAG: LOG family protein [Bacteroidota bacterium]
MTPSQSPVVTIFGSSRPRPGDEEYLTAYDLGAGLARSGFIVCNGGFAGIMEASARGAKEAGGATIGVTFTALGPREHNPWIDNVIQEDTLINRAMRLVSLGDAYVVVKGGTGTLLELAIVWEYINKGLMKEKPILILGSFWKDVVSTLNDELAWEGLDRCTRYVVEAESAQHAVSILASRFQQAKDG